MNGHEVLLYLGELISKNVNNKFLFIGYIAFITFINFFILLQKDSEYKNVTKSLKKVGLKQLLKTYQKKISTLETRISSIEDYIQQSE